MIYLVTQDGFQAASSNSPITYSSERRAWAVTDKNEEYSDWDGTAYTMQDNPTTPPPVRRAPVTP